MTYTENGLDLNFCETKKSLGMPVKCKNETRNFAENPMFERIASQLRVIDYKQFLTRFKWHNLPEGLDSELFERVLYYSGSAMFFYIKELKRFYFLPYAMSGENTQVGIDFYGRFNKIKPYSFNGSTDSKGERKADGKLSKADLYLSTQLRDNIKDIPLVSTEKEARKIFEEGAVICWDAPAGLAYYCESRNRSCAPFIEYMKEILIQTQSALINSSGFNMFSTSTESASDLMQLQIDAIEKDRERGKRSAVVSNLLGEINNLQSNAPASMADFWSSFQAADNLRLKSLGIQNDGVIQKSQYQNIQSQTLDLNDSLQVYMCAFLERVKFAAIVNSIWGLDIYPEPLLLPKEGQQEDKGEEDIDGDSNSQAQKGTNRVGGDK